MQNLVQSLMRMFGSKGNPREEHSLRLVLAPCLSTKNWTPKPSCKAKHWWRCSFAPHQDVMLYMEVIWEFYLGLLLSPFSWPSFGLFNHGTNNVIFKVWVIAVFFKDTLNQYPDLSTSIFAFLPVNLYHLVFKRISVSTETQWWSGRFLLYLRNGSWLHKACFPRPPWNQKQCSERTFHASRPTYFRMD